MPCNYLDRFLSSACVLVCVCDNICFGVHPGLWSKFAVLKTDLRNFPSAPPAKNRTPSATSHVVAIHHYHILLCLLNAFSDALFGDMFNREAAKSPTRVIFFFSSMKYTANKQNSIVYMLFVRRGDNIYRKFTVIFYCSIWIITCT